MKRLAISVALSLVFAAQLNAGIIPIGGYTGCDGQGYQAFQDDQTLERFCCPPNEWCPFGGPGEGGRAAPADKQVNIFTSILLNLYKGRLF